jgi:lysylphosphatidylglycerol synthetase-like protein (DUF2156 family)
MPPLLHYLLLDSSANKMCVCVCFFYVCTYAYIFNFVNLEILGTVYTCYWLLSRRFQVPSLILDLRRYNSSLTNIFWLAHILCVLLKGVHLHHPTQSLHKEFSVLCTQNISVISKCNHDVQKWMSYHNVYCVILMKLFTNIWHCLRHISLQNLLCSTELFNI